MKLEDDEVIRAAIVPSVEVEAIHHCVVESYTMHIDWAVDATFAGCCDDDVILTRETYEEVAALRRVRVCAV